jgi:hypothetical protein
LTGSQTIPSDSADQSATESFLSIKKYGDAFADIEPWSGPVPANYVVNFLGVLRSQDYLIGTDRRANARIEDSAYQTQTTYPDVCDGEEYFEWLDVLATVRSAKESFTMIELGAGYAARSVNANAALNHLNQIARRFVVVEGEDQHFAWAQENFRTNGIDPNDHWFIKALVNATGKPELFVHAPGRYSNMILGANAIDEILENIERYKQSHTVLHSLIRQGDIGTKINIDDAHHDNVPLDVGYISAITLNTILQPLDLIDYLDVDIQYAEQTVIPASMNLIGARVKRIHIGTHAPEIHDNLLALFRDAGWRIVFSFDPQQHHVTPWGNFITSDGILTAVNPQFDDGS